MDWLVNIKEQLLTAVVREPFDASQDFMVFLVGIVLVLLALFLLCGIIYLVSLIFKHKSHSTPDSIQVLPIVQENFNYPSDSDSELVAILTAAIAAYCVSDSYSGGNLQIKSYRRLTNTSPAWSNAGRTENLEASL